MPKKLTGGETRTEKPSAPILPKSIAVIPSDFWAIDLTEAMQIFVSPGCLKMGRFLMT
jgi:hypothetical protein